MRGVSLKDSPGASNPAFPPAPRAHKSPRACHAFAVWLPWASVLLTMRVRTLSSGTMPPSMTDTQRSSDSCLSFRVGRSRSGSSASTSASCSAALRELQRGS